VRKQVLIVDDHSEVRQLLVETLSLVDGELSVREAEDGADALERLRSQPADLVVTDLDMPGMNGIELIRRLRAERRAPAIVVISGASSEWISKAAAQELIGLPFLRKPLDLGHLVSVVREQLAG